MAADQAQAQVHPFITGLQAFQAALSAGGDLLDQVEVGALRGWRFAESQQPELGFGRHISSFSDIITGNREEENGAVNLLYCVSVNF